MRKGATLMAVPFDPAAAGDQGHAGPDGRGRCVIPEYGCEPSTASPPPARWCMFPEVLRQINGKLVWVNRNGTEQPLPAPPHRPTVYPRLSPDGRRVAVETRTNQIWIYDLARDTLTRFTFEGKSQPKPGVDAGRQADCVLSRTRKGQRIILWQLADGSGGLERLSTSEYLQVPAVLVSGWATAGLPLRLIPPRR